jgi:hypothetical protein
MCTIFGSPDYLPLLLAGDAVERISLPSPDRTAESHASLADLCSIPALTFRSTRLHIPQPSRLV